MESSTNTLTPEFLEFELPSDCKKPSVSKWVPTEYQFDRLIEIKKELNKEKAKLDPLHENQLVGSKYHKITTNTYVLEDLRGDNGRLASEFGAQIVTKAWLKIHELFHRYIPMEQTINRKISRAKTAEIPVPRKDLHTFHIAEAPGAFIPSINHMLKTKYPSIEWNWFAESYRNPLAPRKEKGKYLGDQYGLIRKYDSQWIFGAESDGDITKGSNIRWFRHHIGEHFPRLDVVTSDVKFVPTVDFSFDDEEIYNIPVHAGQVITALMTLTKGGIAILKTFTFLESASVSLLYLLSCCFEKVLITKPIASTPANSETYLVCTGFLNNLTPIQVDILYEYLDYCRSHPRKPSALFPKSEIPKKFIDSIVDIQKTLKKRQIEYINRNVNLYESYKDKSPDKASIDTATIRNKFAEEWIKLYKVEPLDEKYWL